VRIIKLTDGDGFIGYDAERHVYLFSFKDNAGRLNFEAVMAAKLIDNDGRVFHLQENGVIESSYKRIDNDWLVAHCLSETKDRSGFEFGFKFAANNDFKCCDLSRIKPLYIQMAGA
jgi:hypothetical protein